MTAFYLEQGGVHEGGLFLFLLKSRLGSSVTIFQPFMWGGVAWVGLGEEGIGKSGFSINELDTKLEA